jgi:hypothetical protein
VSVKKSGTENCEARFRLTKDQEHVVRVHFKVHPDKPIKFATSEVSEQGNGWYLAFSLYDRVDEALKAILNVQTALWHAANRKVVKTHVESLKRSAAARELIKAKAPKRVVVVKKVQGWGGKEYSVAVDRAAQAILNSDKESLAEYRVSKIKAVLDSNPAHFNPKCVSNLAAKFGKVLR